MTNEAEIAIKFFEKHLREDNLKYGERQAIHTAIAALRASKSDIAK